MLRGWWPGWLALGSLLACWGLSSPAVVERAFAADGALAPGTRAALAELRLWMLAGLTPLALALAAVVRPPGRMPELWRGRLRRGVARLGLALGSLLVALVAAEVITRSMLAPPHHQTREIASYRESADPALVYELVPGSRRERDGVVYRVNSEGFRGPEWPPAPACRVLVVGDSLVFGDEVPEDELFWSKLPSAIAAGVGGYGTFQERRLVERLAPRLAPERIVVVFCFNDVDDPYRHVKVSRPLRFRVGALPGTAHPAPAPVPAPFEAPRWGARDLVHHVLYRFSRFYERCCLAVAAVSKPAPPAASPTALDWEHCLTDLADPASARSRWLGEQLKALAALSRSQNRPVGVAIAPLKYQLPPASRHAEAPRRTVAALCAAAGLPCLDLFPHFVKNGGVRLLLDVCHFSAEGHAVTARALGEWLERDFRER